MRRPGLDGLRGLAAFVVLIHHILLTWPTWAAVYVGGGTWLGRTPLHTFVDGAFAVYVFFVLSGFVLALQAERLMSWRGYYGQRLARLYLPVWAAVAFAGLCAVVVHRTVTGTWWLAAHGEALNPQALRSELTLTGGVTWLNSALWSLRWEVLFSLLLPLYLLATRWASRLWCMKLALMLMATVMGVTTGHDSLRYLPMFGCGVVLAVDRQRLPALPRRTLVAGSLIALAGASAYWIVVPLGVTVLGSGILVALQAAAATWAVLMVIQSDRVAGWLSRPLPHWLGTRSFALYLVHEPIVVSVALVSHSSLLTLLVAVPIALAMTEGFFRFIERPSHRMSRTIGRALADLPKPLQEAA